MRTGPANYIDLVLERLCLLPGLSSRLKIAIDSKFIPDGIAPPTHLHGVEVADYRTFSDQVPIGRTRVFFLANNDHHAYVFAALEKQSSLAAGRIISVIHDPSAFMVHEWRKWHGEPMLSEADLAAVASVQYGDRASYLVGLSTSGVMPDIFGFVSHCQRAAITRSHEIWVHSPFAMAKLACETDIPTRQLPKIRVCAHPKPAPSKGHPTLPAGQRMRIGCFGWMTPPKRIASVVQAVGLALDRLPEGAQNEIELLVVGGQEGTTRVDLEKYIAILELGHLVRLIDYADNSDFERLQASSDVIFNLRYPSCGETSGTLATAQGTAATVVISRYQAFNELASPHESVSVLPGFEVWEAAALICRAYEAWQNGSTHDRASVRGSSDGCPVEKLLQLEVIARIHGVHLQARAKGWL